MSAIDANILTATNDRFSLIGTQNFHGIAGELRYQVTNGNAYISGDVNEDGGADFKIEVVGVTSIAASDFVL